MMDERAVWLLDQAINRRGVQIDVQFVARAAVIVGELTRALNAEIADLTNQFVTTTSQVKKLQIWMACEGVRVDSLRKDVITEMLTRPDLDERVREAFELRQAGAKSSTAKLNALINRTCADGRIRDNLMYHAASTGRWGGKGFQPQNLPRPIKEMSPYIAQAINIIRDGCTTEEFVEYVQACEAEYLLKWASKPHKEGELPIAFRPLDMISCCLRPCIIAAPGHELILADYSSIEARGTAWLALAQTLLGVFQTGGDPYLYMACLIDNVPQGTYNKDDHPGPRQRGKVAVLGLGYQMGGTKFQATCHKERIFITEEEAQRIVDVYREGNPEIPELWKELENAAFEAVSSNSGLVTTAGHGRIRFARQGTWLYMEVPSGRVLSYADPRIIQRDMPWIDNRTRQQAKKWCVSYMGVDSMTHQWKRQYGYGGKWCENAVQALCRDLLAGAMLRLEAKGYPVVLSVHDEAISEVPLGHGSVKEYEAIMSEQPAWALDFPIQAEGNRGVRYSK
jgi:DNA polymerase bacteriophage-type